MKIAQKYNHLNAEEYLLCQKKTQYKELENCIKNLDANQFFKMSCEKQRIGKILYSQTDINNEIKKILAVDGWKEKKINYYVTDDENTTRKIVGMTNKDEQKATIKESGHNCYSSSNQVDFQKDRIAIEIQLGKYFSVAYDLHVKHTFFYMRNDIDVGIEIIPTKNLETHMDTGIAWSENEITNVIREGRMNPPVPILILGIEPDKLLSTNIMDYSDKELVAILKNSDRVKLQNQIIRIKNSQNISSKKEEIIDKINRSIQLGESIGAF